MSCTNFSRFLTLLAVLLFLTFNVSAQNTWIKQSPIPTGQSLNDVAWTSASHGFICGGGMAFFETTDGGATWRNIGLPGASSADQPLYHVYFRDANNGFVGGNNDDHWRTTDGGANWSKTPFFAGSWYYVDFVSPTVGFKSANGAFARSTDGGATWHIQAQYPSCPVIYGMDMRDTQVGLAGGNRVTNPDRGDGIFKSTDAGATWVRKFPLAANDVLWLNNSTAIATIGASIYRSVDEGENWTEINNTLSTGLSDMSLLDANTIVGVSTGGDIWRSSDAGFSWTKVIQGIGELPAKWSVSFLNNQIGGVVGASGLNYRTTDGGLTWTMLNSGIGGEVLDLEMFDDTTGLALARNSYILRTTNGGAKWNVSHLQVTGQLFERAEALQALSIVDQDFVVAAGPGGLVFKSFDRGQNWQLIGYPNSLFGEYYIEDVKFTDRNNGFLTGADERFSHRPPISFRTTDGGITWSQINVEQVGTGACIDFVDSNNGWLMSFGSIGQRTTDGGATWQRMELADYYTNIQVNEIKFANQNVGWGVGRNGYVTRTEDGGRTWELQSIGSTEEHLLDLDVISPLEAFATTFSGGIYHTNDGGALWTKYNISNTPSLAAVDARASGKVWVGGFAGEIFFSNFSAPAPAMLLALNPTRVAGGSSAQGTITLGSPAPAGGAVVTLSSDNPSVATVPGNVTVAAGQKTVTFPITTSTLPPASADTKVRITASWSTYTRQATLSVIPAVVCTYAISPNREEFGISGGIVQVRVTAPNGCNWTSISTRSWITIVSGQSGSGNGIVTIQVPANTFTLTRFATIVIAGQNFNVYQSAPGGCDYVISSTSQSFAAAGGSGSVDVTSATGCPWNPNTANDWITVNPGGNRTGNGSFTYTVSENLTGASRTGIITVGGRSHTVYQAAEFADIPRNHPFYNEIGKLAARGVTLGCGNGNFCPDTVVTREQMAAFLLRARGEANPANPASQRFADVSPSNPFYAFIDRMAALQITMGCGDGNYCPSSPVLRSDMSAFMIRALHDPGYVPPMPGSQRFMDVPPAHPFCAHIDEMAVRSITLGCSTNPSMYCPGSTVTRAQMAAFLVRAFKL